ncbi:MAG: uroporphyrinogen-III synthase [Clostridiaceae bacterium]|jgi:uroporphyrinogen III methyltransferase/synthase|nr:uroporphyrinogen-III synthase [Clostridiaceae bacterium]
MQGIVYLIGAGLLGGGGISARGLSLTLSADVIVFDRLISLSLISRIPPDKIFIDVGKPSEGGAARQAYINRMLLRYANDGKTVARLKSGDPFIFGRGFEEAEFLKENGVPFDLVEGVSSITGAASRLGLSLTKRGGSAGVFATSTVRADGEKADISVINAAKATVDAGGVAEFLMGVSRILDIETALLAAGLDSHTPCVFLERAGGYGERAITAPLFKLMETVETEGITAPAVLAVGATGFAEFSRSLAGRRVVLTRPFEKNLPLFERVNAVGGEAVIFPAIETVPLEISRELFAAMSGGVMRIAFSSAAAVKSFVAAAYKNGVDARAFSQISFAVIGEKTAAALKKFGIIADITAKPENSAALARMLFPNVTDSDFAKAKYGKGLKNSSVAASVRAKDGEGIKSSSIPDKKATRAEKLPGTLYLRAKDASDELSRAASVRGADFIEIAAYETLPCAKRNKFVEEKLKEGGFSTAVFCSPSAVRHFTEIFSQPSGVSAVCIGEITAQAAAVHGFKKICVSAEANDEGLFAALLNECRK